MRGLLDALAGPRTDGWEPERAASGTEVLVGSDISVVIDGRTILDEATLTCHAGEVVALVGPNGAGKSTLLGVLAGDVEPSTGDVRVLGRDLDGWGPLELARRRAVVPQRVAVGFPFTVEQVVRMGRAPWQGTPADERDEAVVDAALHQADVAALRTRRVPQLSGGEAARVALARVLAQETQILMLDEPTAALDLHHQEHTMEVLRRLATAGAAVVVVLHDLGLAAAHADRIVVLHAGRIVADGPPADVLAPELVGAVYRHPVDVLTDPRSGAPLVVPQRASRPTSATPHNPPTRETR